MSPDLNIKIARAHQTEIASRALNGHHAHDLADTVDRPRRSVRVRVTQALVTLGACVAAAAALGVGDAHAAARPARSATPLSAAQLASEIHIYKSSGYLEFRCLRDGIAMRNSRGVLKVIPY
ncbi:MAG TPA: hypothetical protein VME22_30165 [Solirubrobacteraceae bacterium]|nr:hypothetical protein [Solirubrobacteraceae bacterium]